MSFFTKRDNISAYHAMINNNRREFPGNANNTVAIETAFAKLTEKWFNPGSKETGNMEEFKKQWRNAQIRLREEYSMFNGAFLDVVFEKGVPIPFTKKP